VTGHRSCCSGAALCSTNHCLILSSQKYKRGHDMKRRGRDLDQIQGDMKKVDEAGAPIVSKIAFDDDLPG